VEEYGAALYRTLKNRKQAVKATAGKGRLAIVAICDIGSTKCKKWAVLEEFRGPLNEAF
jgi:hypothetical protein